MSGWRSQEKGTPYCVERPEGLRAGCLVSFQSKHNFTRNYYRNGITITKTAWQSAFPCSFQTEDADLTPTEKAEGMSGNGPISFKRLRFSVLRWLCQSRDVPEKGNEVALFPEGWSTGIVFIAGSKLGLSRERIWTKEKRHVSEQKVSQTDRSAQ